METAHLQGTSHERRSSPLRSSVKYIGIGIGVFVCLVAVVLVFFPNPILNGFVKGRVMSAFAEAYPDASMHLGNMRYSIWQNSLECDSITLIRSDSSWTVSVGTVSVRGVAWMSMLWNRESIPSALAHSAIDARRMALRIHRSRDTLHIGMLRVSIPDSSLLIDSIRFYSLLGVEEYFARSRYRQTRFRFEIPSLKMEGLDGLAFLHRTTYRAGSIDIEDPVADILVNMDKPYDKNSPPPLMPNEALKALTEIVRVDRVNITNGRLTYRERVAVRRTPGVLTFHQVAVSVRGISHRADHPDTAIIRGEGRFMDSGTMKLLAVIPLASKDFSLRYSGSLSAMDATELNAFIEPCEHRRITAGSIQSATFQVRVDAGRARGSLLATYKDLSVSILDETTGSADGIFNRIASLFGKTFVIRGTNVSDASGVLKTGLIAYTRNRDDYFLQYLWFALRSGVADILGLPLT